MSLWCLVLCTKNNNNQILHAVVWLYLNLSTDRWNLKSFADTAKANLHSKRIRNAQEASSGPTALAGLYYSRLAGPNASQSYISIYSTNTGGTILDLLRRRQLQAVDQHKKRLYMQTTSVGSGSTGNTMQTTASLPALPGSNGVLKSSAAEDAAAVPKRVVPMPHITVHGALVTNEQSRLATPS